MKRWICALLAAALLALSVPALAAGSGLKEAIMVYEDYDGNRAEQTIDDEPTLAELAEMLKRAKKNPGQLDGCTMNSTLFCVVPSGEIYDFSVATDGCPYLKNTEGQYYAYGDRNAALRQYGSTSVLADTFFSWFGISVNSLVP